MVQMLWGWVYLTRDKHSCPERVRQVTEWVKGLGGDCGELSESNDSTTLAGCYYIGPDFFLTKNMNFYVNFNWQFIGGKMCISKQEMVHSPLVCNLWIASLVIQR